MIQTPSGKHCAAVIRCPTCERDRRMLGWYADWYGTRWTCSGCGDSWADGEREGRPFAPGWRRKSVEHARAGLAKLGVQA